MFGDFLVKPGNDKKGLGDDKEKDAFILLADFFI